MDSALVVAYLLLTLPFETGVPILFGRKFPDDACVACNTIIFCIAEKHPPRPGFDISRQIHHPSPAPADIILSVAADISLPPPRIQTILTRVNLNQH